jgi:hypothetical protein
VSLLLLQTGICSGGLTKCGCAADVTGDDCSDVVCPGNCNDQGTCTDMHGLATYALDTQRTPRPYDYSTPWDSFGGLGGCACNTSGAVDNYYTLDSSYGDYPKPRPPMLFRGPQAFAFTDFKGYNCKVRATIVYCTLLYLLVQALSELKNLDAYC